MSTTPQDVFDITMALIDELDENTGSPDSFNTIEYKHRCIYILNGLRGELFPYSDTYVVSQDGKRPICPIITDFDSVIGLDDTICQTVMPYGLAASLLADENPDTASYMLQRYQELRESLKNKSPVSFEAIEGLGTGTAHNKFARW